MGDTELLCVLLCGTSLLTCKISHKKVMSNWIQPATVAADVTRSTGDIKPPGSSKFQSATAAAETTQSTGDSSELAIIILMILLQEFRTKMNMSSNFSSTIIRRLTETELKTRLNMLL